MNQEIKSITSDNGTENYNLDQLNIALFSNNPYSSWQKELFNKNTSKLENSFQRANHLKI